MLSAPQEHRIIIEQFTELVEQAPAGPRIEFGVFRGETLDILAKHEGITYGVDSFDGMGEPGEFDGFEYPRGRLRASLAEVSDKFAPYPRIHLIKGWVPQVFAELPQGPFAFAHIDMDHFAPTLAAIEWCWTRMLPGGIICCDDWFPKRPGLLASKAIVEAIERHRPLDGTTQRKGFWRM